MNIKKALIIGVVIPLCVASFIYAYSFHKKVYSGFCFAEDRYLTDAEIQNAAIDFLVKHRSQDAPEGVDYTKSAIYSNPELPDYDSVEDFRLKNPNCCRPVVTRDPSKHSYSWLLDEHGFEFYLSIYEENVDGFNAPYSTKHRVIACGKHRTATDFHRHNITSIRLSYR